MGQEKSIVTNAAAILFSWFYFRKSLNKKTNIPSLNSVSSITTSGSSYTEDSEGKHDVFLSFRGIDTRLGFTDFLYTYLVDTGICTFRDNNELHIGEEIAQNILKAINDSKISIPIFSRNYADSKWCLNELAHMVKCQIDDGQKIFPIFYDIDPSDVQNQRGFYDKAFRHHEKNFNLQIVQEWREALKTVGRLKGYELKKETNGHEGGLVKKLVKDVLLELKKNYAHVPDELVGMDHHIQKMTRLLELDSDTVRIVGVHGMGGIGKTTIAKVIYNQLCDTFDCCCFLEDVRERAKKHPDGLVDLQKQLVFQILKRDLPDIVTVNDGIKKIKDVVHRKRVLIVLDDADEKSQLDKLAGECNWFYKGSKIIITTRNKDILDALEATCSGNGLHEAYKSYEPELMRDGDSLKLFSKHAFMRDFPPEDYLSLSQKVTAIAAGLPLVLVTLGSLFLGIRGKASWGSKLKKLEKVPDKDIMGKLRISFDALDDDNKKIFLDIACLFVRKNKAMPYYMWEGCEFVPEDGVNTLVLRSLVKVGDDNVLRMHDQLRDLGRQIVREENSYKLSRVWRPEEALKVLQGGLGVENVETLNLDLRALRLDEYEQHIHMKDEYEQLVIEGKEYYVRRLKGHSFSRLQNVRFLRLGCVILDQDFNNLFSNLRWLEWRCCEKFIPKNFCMENLVILNLSNSTVTDEWEGWSVFKVAERLKVLNLSGCKGIIRGPNFSVLKDLESLNLHSCESLLEVSGLERLESLTSLNLMGCKSVVKLPNLSNLRMLRKLLLRRCVKLREIEGLGDLMSLEYLDMSRCESVERLPDLSNLKMLEELILGYCKKLHDIEGFGGLVSLDYLDMNCCRSVERLPDLANLRKLTELRLLFCKNLRDIDDLGGLVSLEQLSMVWCTSLVRLPDLSNLKKLKVLLLSSCFKLLELRGLEGLISLENLSITCSFSMEIYPDLSNLGKLKELHLTVCKLREIKGLDGLVSLEILNLSDNISLENTLDFSCLKNLKVLKLKDLKHWTVIQGLEELKYLQELDVSRISSLEMLPDLSNLTNLKIHAEGCEKLGEFRHLVN